MKNNEVKKPLILFLFFLLVGVQSTEAQFWKKIKDRVKDGVEEAILRKTEEKATKETEKTIDSIFEVPKKMKKKKKGESENSYEDDTEEVDLPAEYNFEWKYALEIASKATNKKNKEQSAMKIVYHLSPNSSTFGTVFDMDMKQSKMGKTIMIMNPDTGANLMLMEMDAQKFIQKMPIFLHQMTKFKKI